jgi:hypothetical protein
MLNIFDKIELKNCYLLLSRTSRILSTNYFPEIDDKN